jgi:flagellar biosynthesis protein FliQ
MALRHALWVSLQIGGPPLVAMLVVGFVIALLQALTQVQEATVAFLPKLLVLGGVLLWLGPFMAVVLRSWAAELFEQTIALGGLR